MKKFSRLRAKFHKLHLGLYFIFFLMLGFGSLASMFFEQYSLIDFGLVKTEWQRTVDAHAKGRTYQPADAVWMRIFRPVGVEKQKNYGYSEGKLTEREGTYQSRQGPLYLYFLALLLWLWPLYRHYFSRKKQDLRLIERRIIHLPLLLFVLGWVMAAQRYFLNVASYTELYGPITARLQIVFAVSAVLLGSFVSYLNLELTGLYIRRRIAAPFFRENDPYGIKSGFAVSLSLRYALMIFSLAIVPLLSALYIQVFANLDLFSRIYATRNQNLDWLLSYENLRVIFPVIIVGALAGVSLVFQTMSMLLYRFNVQTPVSALVRRMKAVAAGDFDCKTSVLYADELGQLKGHFNMMLDGLVERDKIKDTFGRYVSLEIAEKIMKSGKVNLAGEEIQATVLFSDIRGFTPLSEKLPPVELIRFLNEYFTAVTLPITENRGVINKYIGDAVMAIFSPVFGVEDHQAAAVRAALGMRAALKKFNEQKRYPEVCFGVGLHSGGLVAGNVGTEARLEYTVLGDTVNVASRIESQTKDAATQVLLSEAVLRGLDKSRFPGVDFIACAPVLMKGKSHPMVLYKAEPVKV
ncbi:MAG TPA: adenylate/guanylate cyclase domain-containing protein [Elusimicrobiales bacterium]|nr:adenylate/guanylate cyclase domain-containing protein [Elusimicrobiales bacterium]